MSEGLVSDKFWQATPSPQLVFVGKIVELSPIKDADFIELATADCGNGGKWRGVVKKGWMYMDCPCIVYLPDSILPENEALSFLAKDGWRIKMKRFKGEPSEALIVPYIGSHPIGTDITFEMGVTKYVKTMPANLAGIAKGDFPGFIPKTDEENFQRAHRAIEKLTGHPYYITEKLDGSSTTAYKWKGQFGVCSRNLDLEETEGNGYWKVANKYNLREKLPEGYAIQWETCGPGIQGNPLGLPELDGFAFNVWDIEKQRYLDISQFVPFCETIEFPRVGFISGPELDYFAPFDYQEIAKGKYRDSGKHREGIVIRSQNLIDGQMISFKVINLDFKD